jgi:signal transduction histidine kinase/ligand-binding sensor domain-containing protein
VFAAVLGCGNLSASVSTMSDYLIRACQPEDLPDNKVTSIVQTRDGYLWLGTYGGLVRFDGVRFVVFDNNNTPEMHDSSVTSLFEATDGTLWIGHETGEVTRYQKGRFEAVDFKAPPGGSKIYGIAADESGDVWVLNAEGILARLSDGLVLTPRAGSATNLVEMAVSRGGSIWVERNGLLSHLENGALTTIEFAAGSTNNYVHGICASRDGGLWVANKDRLLKWEDRRWTRDLGPLAWDETPLHTFIETRDGRLAAGTSDHGFFLVDPAERPPASREFSRSNGFASDWVLSLCEDREGGLWVGTGVGLYVARASKVQMVAPPDQWEGRAVLSVSPAGGGGLWIGTEGAGLYRFHDGTWERFGRESGIRNPYVWSVAEDAAGRVWAGSWSAGLYLRQGNRFETAPGLEGVVTHMPAIFCGSRGELWIGTGAGLLRYRDGQADWLGPKGERTPRDVRAVVEDDDGSVWIGIYGGGIAHLDGGRFQVFRKQDGLSTDFVLCLHMDREGALWIGTFGGGLNRFKRGRFSVIDQNRGLADSIICHIEEDADGYFWMSSHQGLMRVGKPDLDQCADGEIGKVHCLTFGLSDGMPTLKCAGGLQPAGCKTADGRLWFPTAKGLVTVNPRNISANPLPPPVVIERLLVDNRTAADGTAVAPPLRLPAGGHQIEFQYAALSFVAPEKVRFKYHLKGLDENWVDAGAKRSANFSYLPPGDYTFQVKAANNDGVWNDTGAEFSFKILPHFWQALWFRTLAGGITAAAGGGIVWLDSRRRMRRKLERVDRQRALEHERARIARDIHDDLGSYLTRITMLSESARSELDDPRQAVADMDQIYDTARELTRAMDEIVWAVNPNHDTLESLANYLEKFAQDFLDAAGIRCRLDMPLQFPAWSLTSELRHNLFLALKEALNNVAKHSAASEVTISFAVKGADLEVSVQDNGRGFAPATDGSAGRRNGLSNMRRRLLEIGGRCDIHSAPGQGTKTVFAVRVGSPADQPAPTRHLS